MIEFGRYLWGSDIKFSLEHYTLGSSEGYNALVLRFPRFDLLFIKRLQPSTYESSTVPFPSCTKLTLGIIAASTGELVLKIMTTTPLCSPLPTHRD